MESARPLNRSNAIAGFSPAMEKPSEPQTRTPASSLGFYVPAPGGGFAAGTVAAVT